VWKALSPQTSDAKISRPEPTSKAGKWNISIEC
jgi:hypothetical protein